MLRVITDQTAIKKYARQFTRSFQPFVEERIKVKLGHQGANFPAKVFWIKRLNIWFFSRSTKDARYWNAFGIGKPQTGAMLPITCEINFPWSGIDRKTGGAFARDLSGNVFVIHRGKIGGGKKGIGKSLFEHNYRGSWAFTEDGDTVTQVAVIGLLNSPRFALQIANFVKKIELLKSTAVLSAQMEIAFPEVTFREDRVGSLPSPEEPVIGTPCDRDLIIGTLAALLQRRKFKTGNDYKHELFLLDISENKMSHIFADAVPCIIEPQGDLKAFRKSWARLIQKIYEADPLVCPKCQGKMRVIGSIEDPSVIRAILEHLGLWLVRSRPPPKIHYPPNIEYSTADLQIQPQTDILYGDPEYSWDDYIQA